MSYVGHFIVVVLAIAAWEYYAHKVSRTKEGAHVSGYFHPTFRRVAETFRSNVESGFEHGAAFAVYHNGEVLVDLWGGWADQESERHWKEDTLTLLFSAVKGVVAVVMARLVDMGVLDYKKEVYHYWPAFDSEDKKNITVEMLLSFQAGLIGLDEHISLLDYRDDWDKVERLLATQILKWPSGKAVGFHSMTGGMYADALVRKVDPKHRNLSQFFQDEIAESLGIDVFVGLPKDKFDRFARFQQASFWEQRLSYKELIPFLFNPLVSVISCVKELQEVDSLNNPDLLAIGMPSVLGIGTARSLAKLYDFIANDGTINSQQLLSSAVVDALKEPLTENLPDVFMGKDPFSRGLMLRKNKQGHDTAGFPGIGGTYAFADTTIGAGVAYITNYLSLHLSDDPREVSLRDAFYKSFEDYKAHKKILTAVEL